MVMNRFKSDPEYRLDTMTHQFLPCLMQLKLGSDEDIAYISEIQRAWCLLLDKFERTCSSLVSTGETEVCSLLLATERSICLEEFLQRLLEYPLGQHYHSVSINKHQLISRYEEAVRELIHRYPSLPGYAVEQKALWTPRSVRSTSLNTPVSIPVVIQHSQAQHRATGITVSHPRGASPMQQGGEEQQPCPPPRPPPPTTPPSTSLPPSSS